MAKMFGSRVGLQRWQDHELVVAVGLESVQIGQNIGALMPAVHTMSSAGMKVPLVSLTPLAVTSSTRAEVCTWTPRFCRIFSASSASRFGKGGRMRSAASIRFIVMSFPGSMRS